MSVTERAARWAGARMSRRLARSLPWVGAAVALATVAATVRRKGWIGGAVETALNSVPIVGALKNTAELVTGHDLVPNTR